MYNTHSFRSGRATQLAQDNIPDRIIKQTKQVDGTVQLMRSIYVGGNFHFHNSYLDPMFPPYFPYMGFHHCFSTSVYGALSARFSGCQRMLQSGGGKLQSGNVFRAGILLAISACCRLQDLVSKCVTLLHFTKYS